MVHDFKKLSLGPSVVWQIKLCASPAGASSIPSRGAKSHALPCRMWPKIITHFRLTLIIISQRACFWTFEVLI